MERQELHVVLGAGQVGPQVAELLRERGHHVRIGRRTKAPARIAGIETVSLDVRDADAVAEIARGASVVYNCVNPLYTEWPAMIMPMARGITDGCRRAGAKLVALDNLYMYGDTSRMNESSLIGPVSKKGALRAEAGKVLLDAGATIGRAADFFGPEAHLTLLGEHFWKRVLAGKSAQVFGDPDQVHAYSYAPDVASALVALGSRSKTEGVWMLPVLPAESTRAVIGRFARALDRDIAVGTVPTWFLRGAGVFAPMLRELAEMTYQWQQPYVVDDAKFRNAFGMTPTPWDDAVAATVRWARRTWAANRPVGSDESRSDAALAK